MESGFAIRPQYGPIFLWLLLLGISSLAGAYLGGFYIFLRMFIFLLLPASLLHLKIIYSGLRLSQDFSSDHPNKGEAVDYQFTIMNESPLPALPIQLRFAVGQQGIPDLNSRCSLGPQGKFMFKHQIICPYRGVYNAGASQVLLHDLFGFVQVDFAVWIRTFYVYPRIIPLHISLNRISSTNRSSDLNSGIQHDPSLTRSIAEYQPGSDIRHISWKKTAQYGKPMIREFDVSSARGLSIFIDTRPTGENGDSDPLIEDLSLEAALSLARRCVDQGIPADCFLEGMPVFRLHSTYDLKLFRERSISMFFRAQSLRLDRIPSQSAGIIMISHRIDSPVLSQLQQRPGKPPVRLISNLGGSSEERIRAVRNLQRRERLEQQMAIISSIDELEKETSEW